MKKICLIFAISSLLGLGSMIFGMDDAQMCTIILPNEGAHSNGNQVFLRNCNTNGFFNIGKDYATLKQFFLNDFMGDVEISPDKKAAKIVKPVYGGISTSYNFNSPKLIRLFQHHQTIKLTDSSRKEAILTVVGPLKADEDNSDRWKGIASKQPLCPDSANPPDVGSSEDSANPAGASSNKDSNGGSDESSAEERKEKSFTTKTLPHLTIGLLGVILLYCASRYNSNSTASQFVDAAFHRLDKVASRGIEHIHAFVFRK